jgi:hypothetical protein
MLIHVIPRGGLVVRDPETAKALPPDGLQVERSPYWVRRLNDGDVFVSDATSQRGQTKKDKETAE